MDAIWWVLITILFILAYAGLILPALPDIPLVFAGFLIYHFLIDPDKLGLWTFWIPMALITVLMFILDYVSSAIAAKKYGGSKWSMWASVLGVIIFPFILGPIGIIVGPFLLVFLVEISLKRDVKDAFKIGFSTFIGFIGGVFVKFLVMTGMKAYFFYLVFS